MKIEVLGTGCSKCHKLRETVIEAVKELHSDAQVAAVDQINEIMAYGVMTLPALAINGTVVVAGRVPSKDEIIQWLNGSKSGSGCCK